MKITTEGEVAMNDVSVMMNSLILSFLVGMATTLLIGWAIGLLRRGKQGKLDIEKRTIWKKANRDQMFWETNSDACLLLNTNGEILEVNPALRNLIDFEDSVENGRSIATIMDYIGQEEVLAIRKHLHRMFQGETLNANVTLVIKSNRSLHVNVTFLPLTRGKKVLGGILMIRDYTDQKNMEEQLYHQAYYDALTDLPNRRLLEFRFQEALQTMKNSEQMEKLAVMFLDIDSLQGINHSLGHQFGDLALITIANRLKACVRDCDTVARLDGDEFILLLPSIMQDELLLISDKIIQAIEQPCLIKGHEVHVTASIGVASYPDDGQNVQALIKQADTAMFHAKSRNGSHYKLFSPIMNDVDFERSHVESELQRALKNKELRLYYQPKVSLETQRIVAMEALIRWDHPIKGLIVPDEFVPLAEQTGLIVPIGEWVLRTACKQAVEWQQQGYPPIRISINLANRQVWKHNFIEMIAAILKETGLKAEYLELELTENMLLNNNQGYQLVHQIKELGVQVSIDQFGSDLHSLRQLIGLPVDRINIDRPFIYELPYETKNQAVVLSVIALAHQLDWTVLAKGVETQEELNYLSKHHCDEYQGYLFQELVSSEKVKALLRQNLVLLNRMNERSPLIFKKAEKG
ncbi:bifunctional diguanylate cyclase/phosphodiesterase [Brevibacillus laterosporus]|nr:bifunctional diguanylate cyclase/phosphodiesterase [Brevibacillus laterosporus]